MTLLNFPSDPASVDNIYVGPNGVTYIFDGVKWVGQSAGGGGISTELVSGSHHLTMNPDGSMQFPYFTIPAGDGANGQVLKTNGSGVLSWSGDSTTTYRLYNTNLTNPAQHYTLEVDTNGVVVLPDRSIINGSTLRGIYGTGEANFTGITIGPDAAHREESWVWVDSSGSHIATRYSGEISAAKQWDFNNSGDFIIPNGGHIKYQNGSPYSLAATNTGNFIFTGNTIATSEPDNIQLYTEDADYGIVIGDSELGSYVAVNGLIDDQVVEIVTQTGGREPNNTTQWYNILANLADTSAAYNSSVLYGSDGNVYTIGGCVTSDFVTDNLFQKFNPNGNREWKKTWTTSTGIHCGSINQSARMITAGNYGYTQDTILWTSHSSTEGISYVGRMDTDGNFTNGAGTPTNPIKIDQNNTYVSDLEPTSDGGFVYITGHHENGSNSTYPFISKIDLNSPSQSVPAYRVEIPDMAPNDSYNMFKTIAQDATFDGMFTAGFYYDGSNGYYSSIFSAWTDLGEGGLGHIGSYQVGNTLNSTVLLETVAVNNHAAYVVANYGEGRATVIKVTQTGPNTYTPQWQTRLGNMEYGAFGTGLAFDSDNNVYLMIDTMAAGLALTKLDDTDGTVVWSRLISSGFMKEGALIIGQPGNTTSSDIQVHGNLAVLTGYTYDKSNESGCFTIQYNIATHPTGTYGDFTIYDVDLGYASDALSITPLNVNVFDFTLYTSNESMISTVSTTTGGWDETHWDMVLNQEVYSTSSLVTNTWTYGTDGSLTIPLAGKIINNNKTWTFDSVGDLAVPGQVKNAQGHRAIWSNEVPRDISDLTDTRMLLDRNTSMPDTNWDGGAAAATYATNTNADGGFSSTRWGRNTTKFDGGANGEEYTLTLNGGGA